ncbi:MAG: 1-deoxy-D-xylulose-5-phosphate synthase [Bacteroidales bacterium]|nr:1-deoxy-D-xylulose-5-phosphate synthase [Bacteroidales bacterium]
MQYKFLNNIKFPTDLKKLEISVLPELCNELRDFIITKTAENPGHLGASLGTIELTVALHYVFNAPEDKMVWDVGHQAYCHKILTGRKDNFDTNRHFGGISGFPNRFESEYDAIGTGHSSTSVSAILGMAIASKLKKDNTQNHIAIIGDGAIGGGMAFEAMNHAGATNANMLIILNDNKIAIDQNVGAMSKYLLHITTSPSYNRFKNRLWNLFSLKKNTSNRFTRFISKSGNNLKGFILRGSNLFQSLGFRYFGPVDGHDVIQLVKVLKQLKEIQGPKLLHILTVKGKGLAMAERNQTTYHAPGKFDPDTGERLPSPSDATAPDRFQDVFGHAILELAEKDNRVVGITPAMAPGCSLTIMREKYPDRVFDVGIAEQHAVTFSAGLALQGIIPFCNIYSSFLQRAYDQLIHDVALQKAPVILCVDRAGIVGEDGATHQGAFDLAFLRTIPDLVIMSPMNEVELRNMMFTAYKDQSQPFAIRYPRGRGVLPKNSCPEMEAIPIGKGRLLKTGEKVAFLSIGPIGNTVSKAIQILEQQHNINAGHIDLRFLKPLDNDLILSVASQYETLITVEDGTEKGGLYSAVAELLETHHLKNHLIHIAIPDQFVPHGSPEELYHTLGMDTEGIVKTTINSI